MNKESLESKIANILDTRDEMKRLEHNLELGKKELLKEMKEAGIDFVNTHSGNAVIRAYDVQRYDKFEVDMLVEKINDGIDVDKDDIKNLAKTGSVEFVLVKGLY